MYCDHCQREVSNSTLHRQRQLQIRAANKEDANEETSSSESEEYSESYEEETQMLQSDAEDTVEDTACVAVS